MSETMNANPDEAQTTTDDRDPRADLIRFDPVERQGVTEEVIAHIKVSDGDEWVGDFYATFERGVLGGKPDTLVADWSTVKQGNGLYVDETPPFWPVEEVVDTLETCFVFDFVAMDTGPNDI